VARKIWIVSSGQYSDYGIVAVFSTKEKANKFTRLSNEFDSYDEYRVEEFPLDEKVARYFTYRVEIGEDGSWSHYQPIDLNQTKTPSDWHWSVPSYTTGEITLMGLVVVYGRQEQRAIKIANDKRTRIRALNLWGDPAGLDV
jgi:hypothetical protein